MRIPVKSEAMSTPLGFLIGLWSSTYRVRVWQKEREDELKARGESVIYVFWHNRLLPLIPYYRRYFLSRFPQGRVDVLVSKSKDGEIMARVLHRFGFGTVRGSSSRGGREAMVEMARRLKRGFDIGIIPDGPRGPRYVAKTGAVALARVTGSPILPVGVSARPVYRFNSWDRFMLPLPFARVAVCFGHPIYVGRREDLEESRRSLEQALMEITRQADGFLGVKEEY